MDIGGCGKSFESNDRERKLLVNGNKRIQTDTIDAMKNENEW
jgi:hypothetical protein